MTTIEQIQDILGVKSDGIWGPKSQAALNGQIASTGATANKVICAIQKVIGMAQDGKWDTDDQTAFLEAVSGITFSCHASSFADPADVVEYKRRKAAGMTDKQAFKYGDNGIGQFGRITAQDDIPMVALHRSAMLAKWGSEAGAAHRPIMITLNGVSIKATVEDRISALNRVDCNPAVAKLAHLKPPFVVPCTWRWL